ncbi:MAG: hypothetical protein HKN08_07540 [Gammaproteobacteria bacterium]|nr:hypothetical protein [Gammaproteobacteria bacterium]
MIGGFASEQLKCAGYEVAYNNQCVRDTGLPDCDPEHSRFDDYSRERQQALDYIQDNKAVP